MRRKKKMNGMEQIPEGWERADPRYDRLQNAADCIGARRHRHCFHHDHCHIVRWAFHRNSLFYSLSFSSNNREFFAILFNPLSIIIKQRSRAIRNIYFTSNISYILYFSRAQNVTVVAPYPKVKQEQITTKHKSKRAGDRIFFWRSFESCSYIKSSLRSKEWKIGKIIITKIYFKLTIQSHAC